MFYLGITELGLLKSISDDLFHVELCILRFNKTKALTEMFHVKHFDFFIFFISH